MKDSAQTESRDIPIILSVPHSPSFTAPDHQGKPISSSWYSPNPRKVAGSSRPTPTQQTQPPSCLQEVNNMPFVFSFYKRKLCGGLPGRRAMELWRFCAPFNNRNEPSRTARWKNNHGLCGLHAQSVSIALVFWFKPRSAAHPHHTPILLFKQLPRPCVNIWQIVIFSLKSLASSSGSAADSSWGLRCVGFMVWCRNGRFTAAAQKLLKKN